MSLVLTRRPGWRARHRPRCGRGLRGVLAQQVQVCVPLGRSIAGSGQHWILTVPLAKQLAASVPGRACILVWVRLHSGQFPAGRQGGCAGERGDGG